WKSNKSLRTNIAYARYIASVEAEFSLSATQAAVVKQMKRANRQDIALILLAMLHDRQHPDAGLVCAHLCRCPAILADLLRVFGREAVRRIPGLQRISADAR